MSLLTNGPHTVTVYPEEIYEDFEGNRVKRPGTVGVVVAGCFMQPVATARGAFSAAKVKDGQHVLASHKLICADAPAGWWSRVVWTDDSGLTRNFVPLGGPLIRHFSKATQHISVTLKEER